MYFTREQVLGYLNGYVKTLSLEEQFEFQKHYDWVLASKCSYFKETMPLLDEYERTGTLSLYPYFYSPYWYIFIMFIFYL